MTLRISLPSSPLVHHSQSILVGGSGGGGCISGSSTSSVDQAVGLLSLEIPLPSSQAVVSLAP